MEIISQLCFSKTWAAILSYLLETNTSPQGAAEDVCKIFLFLPPQAHHISNELTGCSGMGCYLQLCTMKAGSGLMIQCYYPCHKNCIFMGYRCDPIVMMHCNFNVLFHLEVTAVNHYIYSSRLCSAFFPFHPWVSKSTHTHH